MPTLELEFSTGTLEDRITMRDVLARTRLAPGIVRVEQVSRSAEAEGYVVHFDRGITDATRRIFNQHQTYLSARREPSPEVTTRRIEERLQREPRPTNVPEDLRSRLISEALQTSEGRTRLAMSMVAPLRTGRDYQSIARNTFRVEQLPDGALSTYDRTPEPPAPFPDWVRVGVWAYDASTDRYIQVQGLETITMRAEVQHWRTSAIEHLDSLSLARYWVSSLPPEEPDTRFERNLFD